MLPYQGARLIVCVAKCVAKCTDKYGNNEHCGIKTTVLTTQQQVWIIMDEQAPTFQADGCRFESRFPLQSLLKRAELLGSIFFCALFLTASVFFPFTLHLSGLVQFRDLLTSFARDQLTHVCVVWETTP